MGKVEAFIIKGTTPDLNFRRAWNHIIADVLRASLLAAGVVSEYRIALNHLEKTKECRGMAGNSKYA